MNKVVIAIDPGANGGIVMLNGTVTSCYKMPKSAFDLHKFIGRWPTLVDDSILKGTNGVYAFIEKVGGYVGKPQSGSMMFNFGINYGMCYMALVSHGIPFQLVTPQKWQSGLGIIPRGKAETTVQWKGRLKAKAQTLFPKAKVILNYSDALLLAHWGQKHLEGKV